MKFVRYGSLAPQKAKRWSIDHAPMPAPRGIYAFPYGYMDYWYVWSGRGCDANPRVQYLKDEAGRRLFIGELLDMYFFTEESMINRINVEYPNLTEEQKARLWRRLKCWQGFNPRWAMYLAKKYHLKSGSDVLQESRKSWIMVMDDPSNPPRLTHDPNDPKLTPEQVEAIPLNQKLHFLKGEDGQRILAEDFMNPAWSFERFWNDIHPLAWDEIQASNFIEKQSFKVVSSPFRRASDKIDVLKIDAGFDKAESFAHKTLQKWLTDKEIRLEQLCPWPVYTNNRRYWAAIYAQPHVFEYSGCLWHELGDYIKPKEIIQRVGGWCYSTIGAYQDALRKADPLGFEIFHGKNSVDPTTLPDVTRLHNFSSKNYLYRTSHCFQVFIDSKLVEKKQN